MQYVLVLNVGYQALGVVEVEKAISLIVIGRAETVHARDGVFRSQKLEIPVPSVIRIFRNIKPKREDAIPVSRKALFARDNYECQYCGKFGCEVEHIIPQSRGGKNTWENLVTACRSCNSMKADMTPEEAGMILRNAPYTPTRANLIALRGSPEWRDYLK